MPSSTAYKAITAKMRYRVSADLCIIDRLTGTAFCPGGSGLSGMESVAGVAKWHLVRFGLWFYCGLGFFGARAPVGGVHREQREGRDEQRADDRPCNIRAEGQRVLERFPGTVLADRPARDGGETEVGNQRRGASPGQRIERQHGNDDEQPNDGSERREHKRQHRVGMQLPHVLRKRAERIEEIADYTAPPAQLLLEDC